MVIFLTILLGISIVGLVSLLMLKRWELQTGKVIGGHIRPAFGEMSGKMFIWVERFLPALLRAYTTRVLRGAGYFLGRTLAEIALFVETRLEQALELLRSATEHRPPAGTASAFLREVAAHKEELQRRRPLPLPGEDDQPA